MIALAILSCWLRISIFPRFYLGTVLKPTVIHTICLLYTPTLLLLSVSLYFSPSLFSIHCLLRSMLMLLLKTSGKSLGSRLGLSTPVGSNFGQTTVALMWVYRVAQKCRTILCNFK